MTTQRSTPKKTGKRPPGRPKGYPRTGGRQKGTPNKVTVEAKQAANALVDDPVYRRKLARDFRARKVHHTVEAMLWHYAKGKPVERHEVGTPGDFAQLSDTELKTQLAEALEKL